MLEHSEKVLGETFVSNDQTPEVLQPGKQPFDLPPSSVSLQPTSSHEVEKREFVLYFQNSYSGKHPMVRDYIFN
jgi:hypothetical protein